MKKTVILHSPVSSDAPDDEQDTIAQVREVSAELTRMGFDTSMLAFGLNLGDIRHQLLRQRPDFVFNLVESVEGHDRFIMLAPMLLESMGIPFTGSATRAVMTTTCKTAAKSMLPVAGIGTPPWVDRGGALQGMHSFPGTYIIKSVWDHASAGLDQGSVVETGSSIELIEVVGRKTERHGREFFGERFIDGREFNISLIAGESGPEVLPPAEIVFQEEAEMTHRIVDYRAKWQSDSKEYRGTPRSFEFSSADGALLSSLSDISLRCWHLFGMRGYARVDFRVDRDGVPLVLEVNANPCITSDSGFIAAAERGGLTFSDVIERVLRECNRCSV